MSNQANTKKTVATRAGNLITGMKAKYPNGATVLQVGGSAVTVDATIANLQAIVDNRAAVTAARAAAQAKVAEENAKMPSLLAFMNALVKVIRASFGTDATALAVFDLAPPKARTPMTAEEKAAAVAKREATVKARGVVGTRKRAKVKGDVTATLVVTPAAAAPAAEPPAPAAAPAATVTPPKA